MSSDEYRWPPCRAASRRIWNKVLCWQFGVPFGCQRGQEGCASGRHKGITCSFNIRLQTRNIKKLYKHVKQKMSMSMIYRHLFDLSLFKYYSYTEWSCISNSLHMICVWLWQIHTHSCYCISKHACHKIFSHALVFNMHHENADCKVKSYFYKMS